MNYDNFDTEKEQLKDKLAVAELLISRNGLQQIKLMDQVRYLTKERDAALERLAKADGERDELRVVFVDALDILRGLHDYQNGCPLPSYEKGWNKYMDLTKKMLHKHYNQSPALRPQPHE